ncbi:hypothetical protein CEXT_798981 [Caerostris extrusa]|uniref:Secreted protein n=1 Tax=Caerostris extrusa TaxID=172846 RepID=A0AAV4NHK2_CAEEX|nr:hypothetical protein CEXT_798981 [Caerostris extrusa]
MVEFNLLVTHRGIFFFCFYSFFPCCVITLDRRVGGEKRSPSPFLCIINSHPPALFSFVFLSPENQLRDSILCTSSHENPQGISLPEMDFPHQHHFFSS